jgi:hypothetical protein
LAKDIAKQLGDKPVAPLLTALAERKTSLYTFEEADTNRDTSMRCQYLCLRPDAPFFVQACGQPVLWSSELYRCAEHCYKKDAVFPKGLPRLTPIEDESELLYVTEDSSVIDANAAPVGHYNRETRILTRFTIEE